MVADTIDRGPSRKEMEETSGTAPKLGELHRDVEDGPEEMINIDRIEKVYK